MSFPFKAAKAKFRRKAGAPKLEYAILLGLVAVGALGAVSLTGTHIQHFFEISKDHLSSASTPSTPGLPEGEGKSTSELSWMGGLDPIEGQPGAPGFTTLQLVNTGKGPSDPLNISHFSAEGVGFGLVSTTCLGVLAAGSQCDVVYSYTPVGPEQANGEAVFTLDPQSGRWPLVGMGVGFQPKLVWSGNTPLVLNAPTTFATQTLTLANEGTLPSQDLSDAIALTGTGWTIPTHSCTILGVGDTCRVSLQYTGQVNGTYPATLSANQETPVSVQALVQGFDPAWSWDATPDAQFAIQAPSDIPATLTKTFVLRNTGYAAGIPNPLTLTGPFAHAYTLSQDTCVRSVAPNSTCSVATTYTASSNTGSSQTAVLASGAHTKPLSGTAAGFATSLTWSDNNADLDTSVFPGPARTYTLTNTGTAASSNLNGMMALTGPHNTRFTLFNNTCTSALTPGASCTVDVRLANATPVGSYNAILGLQNTVVGWSQTYVDGSVISTTQTPNPFAFNNLTGQQGNVLVASNIVRPSGTTAPGLVSISGQGDPQLSTDGGATWNTSATLPLYGSLQVRLTTGPADGSARAATITMGPYSTTWTVATGDATPGTFALAPYTGEELNVFTSSAAITPTGFTMNAPIRVSGEGSPMISVNGSAFTAGPSTISPGQYFMVRLTTANAQFTERLATVNVGGVFATWSVSTGGMDNTPDPYLIPAKNVQEPNARVVSDAVKPTGYDLKAAISITGSAGSNAEYSLDAGATWTSTAGKIRPDQRVMMRLMSQNYGLSRTATLNINGVSSTWTVTTRGQDKVPDAFTIAALTNQPGNTTVLSQPVLPIGYQDAAAISVSGSGTPLVSVNNGPFLASTTIVPGQTFRVQMNTPDPNGLTQSATVTMEGVSSTWSVSTIDTMPNVFTLTAVEGAPGTDYVASYPQGGQYTFQGFTSPARVSITQDTALYGRIMGPNFLVDGRFIALDGQEMSPGFTADALAINLPSIPNFQGNYTFHVGGTTFILPIKTYAADLMPEVSIIPSVANATPGQWVWSQPFHIPSITAPIPVVLPGGQASDFHISIDGGQTFTPLGTYVHPGPDHTVILAMQAPPAGQTKTIRMDAGVWNNPDFPGSGTIISYWSVSSAPPDSTPDPWRDLSFTASDINSQYHLTNIQVTGTTVPVDVSVREVAQNGQEPWYFYYDHNAQFSETAINGGKITMQPNEYFRIAIGSGPYYNTSRTFNVTVGTRTQSFTVTNPTGDTTPDPFAFTNATNVEGGSNNISNGIVPVGYTVKSQVRVSGDPSAMISVNNGAFSAGPLDITPGQSLRVKLTASSIKDGTAVQATVSIGVPGTPATSATYTVSTLDHTPNAFSFASITGAEPGALTASAPASITAMAPNTPFSVANGYATIDSSSSLLTSGTISSGQTIRIWANAASYGQDTVATATIGQLSNTFTVSTRSADYVANAFSIPSISNVPANALTTSGWVLPTGYLDAVWVNANGGNAEVQIEGDSWTTAALINPGQRFRVRATAGAYAETLSVKVRLGQTADTTAMTAGGTLSTWTIKTAGAP